MTEDDIITKYPKIFKQYVGNPGGVNWEIPRGWIKVIDWMCGTIQGYVDGYVSHSKDGEWRPQQVVCTQIKEKWGGLRFYTHGADKYVDGIVAMATHICYDTCIMCGSNEDVTVTNDGWVMYLCDKCKSKSKEIK